MCTMETTKLIIEYVVGGVVVSLALLLLAWSLFPAEVLEMVVSLNQSQSSLLTTGGVATALFAAVVYAVGVISEFVGESAFRRRFDRVRGERFAKYIGENRELFDKDPILGKLAEDPATKIDLDAASQCVGQMRFHVLMKSPSLYTDIDSQLNRLRLIRVLFLAELILTGAIVALLLRHFSVYLVCSLLLVIVVGVANWMAVTQRFHRYNRSVERAYRALRLALPDVAQARQRSEPERDDCAA